MASEVFILQSEDQCFASSTSSTCKTRKSRSWTDTEIKQLIRLWSANSMLYDSKDRDYFKSDTRRMLIEGISANLGISYPDTIKKMESLRAYYGREKWRAFTYNKKAAPGDSYKSRWCYYDPLKFLETHMTFKRRTSAFPGDDEEPDTSSESFYTLGFRGKTEKASKTWIPKTWMPKADQSVEENLIEQRSSSSESKHANIHPLPNSHVFPGVEDELEKEPEITYSVCENTTPTERTKPLTNITPCEKRNEKLPFIKSVNLEEKHPDIVFAELIARNLMDLPDGADKEILKLQIQTLISCAKYPQIRGNPSIQQAPYLQYQPSLPVHSYQSLGPQETARQNEHWQSQCSQSCYESHSPPRPNGHSPPRPNGSTSRKRQHYESVESDSEPDCS